MEIESSIHSLFESVSNSVENMTPFYILILGFSYFLSSDC